MSIYSQQMPGDLEIWLDEQDAISDCHKGIELDESRSPAYQNAYHKEYARLESLSNGPH